MCKRTIWICSAHITGASFCRNTSPLWLPRSSGLSPGSFLLGVPVLVGFYPQLFGDVSGAPPNYAERSLIWWLAAIKEINENTGNLLPTHGESLLMSWQYMTVASAVQLCSPQFLEDWRQALVSRHLLSHQPCPSLKTMKTHEVELHFDHD